MENSVEVPQKTRNRVIMYPAIPLLSIHIKERKSMSKRYLQSHVHCSTLYDRESTYVSIGRWIKKMWRNTMEFYLAIKKE
jgi:hypothetical protein